MSLDNTRSAGDNHCFRTRPILQSFSIKQSGSGLISSSKSESETFGLPNRCLRLIHYMGWNKAIDGKGSDRSCKGGSCHQPRQDKGHENRKMTGDGQDCDRRGAD